MNIIIGLLSGVAASMGFGGGFVLIIYLTVFLNIDQITAQGVNLLFFLPVALVSIIIEKPPYKMETAFKADSRRYFGNSSGHFCRFGHQC